MNSARAALHAHPWCCLLSCLSTRVVWSTVVQHRVVLVMLERLSCGWQCAAPRVCAALHAAPCVVPFGADAFVYWHPRAMHPPAHLALLTHNIAA
eukprot:2412784-Alexandrium_andersonii.AAC.1